MKLYTIDEISEMFSVSSQVIRREIKSNKLVGHRFGGRIYVMQEDLDAYINQSATNNAKPEAVSAPRKVKRHAR